ncbi:MAG: hypothetical protein KGM98_09870 [Bacteroidota bacterium]|nr:hypothetical protein [Bacteroidota bacterium]
MLVDVEYPAAISEALKKIMADQAIWEKYSSNGIKATTKLYSWKAHTDRYMKIVDNLFARKEVEPPAFMNKTAYGKRLAKAKIMFITDLDGTRLDGNQTTGLDELKQ